MADLTLRDVKKAYGSRATSSTASTSTSSRASSSSSSARRAAASRRCCASIAGLEEITGGDAADRRRGGQRRAAVQARHRHGVPVLRALSAHDGLRQHGLRHEDRRARARHEIDRRVRAGGRDPAAHQISRPPAEGAVGRPAPARRHRPRHRAQPEGLPVRRAAVQPRRRAARRHPHRDRQAQGAAWPTRR